MKHPNPQIAQLIVQLADALCEWERNTGRESVLIVKEPGFEFRALSGKPGLPADVPNEQLLNMVA